MAKILIAWELGGGYGHIERMAPLAESLSKNGHEVLIATSKMAATAKHPKLSQFPLSATPRLHTPIPSRPTAINYADILLRWGYQDASGLIGIVQKWLKLFEDTRPDVLVGDSAPTAMLAARISGLKTAFIGTGFQVPPNHAEASSLQPWNKIPEKALLEVNSRVLESVNGTLRQFQCDAIGGLAALWPSGHTHLCTVKELDHYERAPDSHYCGTFFSTGGGTDNDWAGASRPRIVVYLNGKNPKFAMFMEELGNLGFAALVHTTGNPGSALGDRVTITASPIDLPWAMKNADLAISHGGHGFVSAALMHGVPVMVFPEHLEQALMGHRLTQQGLGAVLSPQHLQKELRLGLKLVLKSRSYTKKASAFSKKYAGQSPAETINTIAASIHRLAIQ